MIFGSWKPFKNNENAFYFTLKALFVLKILNLYLDFLVMQQNPEREKQTIAIHILPNISKSKGNQTIKFGQLIGYIWEAFFLKNHTQNVLEKQFPDLFLKRIVRISAPIA